MLNVAIAVEPATDYGTDAVTVVAAACEEVIGPGRCPIASAIVPGTVTAWHALVRPIDPALSSVRIELRDRSADGVMIEERVLVFSSRDSPKSRLASAGSVIAAMAAAREGSLVQPPIVDDPPRPRESIEVPMREVEPPDWGIDLSALVAPSFGNEPLRLGGSLGAHVGFARRPFLLISARYAARIGEQGGDPSFTWLTASAGIGTRIFDRASLFNVEVSGEFAFEHTVIAAERVSANRGTERDSASENGMGGRFRALASWQAWRHVGVIAAVDATAILPRITVVLGDDAGTRVPPVSIAFSIGLRFVP